VFIIKKLILFTLLTITALIFAACDTNSSEQAMEYLEKANIAMNDIDSMRITFTTETSAPVIGTDLIIDTENVGTIEAVNTDTSFEGKVSFSQNLMGNDFEYSAFYRNGTVAITDLPEEMSAIGVGLKGTAQHETPLSLINIHLDFPQEAILDHERDVVDDGVQLTLSLDNETLLRTVNGQLNSEDFTVDNLVEYDYQLIILLDEDNLIQTIEVDISFTYEIEEEEFDASMLTSLEVTQETGIDLEFPDNIDDFLDLGMISLPPF